MTDARDAPSVPPAEPSAPRVDAGAGPGPSIATELVLYAGCLPATPFRELVAAASATGFDAVTLWPLTCHRARSREGLDDATMRSILDDHGIAAVDLESCGVWVPDAPPGVDTTPLFSSKWDRHQFLDTAVALGVENLVAGHLGTWAIPHDDAVAAFAQLCDDAADRGLRVALEAMSFSGLADQSAALAIVTDADRPNAGVVVDVCHLVRSGTDPGFLDGLSPELVACVQLSDGPATAPEDLHDESMFHRLLPGTGEFDLADLLARLRGAGVATRVGPELYQRGFSERPAEMVADDLMAATRSVLGMT